MDRYIERDDSICWETNFFDENTDMTPWLNNFLKITHEIDALKNPKIKFFQKLG